MMTAHGRLPLRLPDGQKICMYPRLHAQHGIGTHLLTTRFRPHSLWPLKANVQAKALSDFSDSPDFFDKDDFFGRKVEQSLLLAQLQQSPTSILVLVGPYNSGKTRLLKEVLVERKKHKGLVTFVNGRSQKLTDAGIMAALLKEQGARQLCELKQTLKTTGRMADAAAAPGILDRIKFVFGVDAEPLAMPRSVQKTFQEDAPCSLHDVIKAYGSLLRLSSSTTILGTSSLPVVCIDEANVLMGWYKGGAAMEDDLDALLRFFVKVSKEDRQAHVILATSEYSFVPWLDEKLGNKSFRTQVIGDFPKAEARLYLEHNMGASITDAEWAKVFDVCGGNAGDLLTGIEQYRLLKDWTKATEQYRTILALILEDDHPAVIATDAYRALDPGGKQAVQAMVEANLLVYRPASGWARDIPLEAFGPEQQDVVTAPSPAHLYSMRIMVKEPLRLNEQIRDIIDRVRGMSDAVDQEMEELKIIKPDGWEVELAYLIEKQTQFRSARHKLCLATNTLSEEVQRVPHSEAVRRTRPWA